MRVFEIELTSGQTLGLAVAAGVACMGLFKIWMQGPKFKSSKRLDGKTVVVTGANTGIGKVCAIDLAKRGGKVIILCRNKERGEAALRDIIEASGSTNVHFYLMDLADMSSIRACAARLNEDMDRVDILLNNAGVMACLKSKTADGLEMQIGTNHFGHFLLTHLLVPLLMKAAPGARVVNVSSMAHEMGEMHFNDLNFEESKYDPFVAYAQSKLANVLFSREFAVRYGHHGIHSYSLHPGAIATELGRHVKDSYGILPSMFLAIFMLPFMKTPEYGAQTSLYCCLEESIADDNGKYYSDCREKEPSRQASNRVSARELWEISEKVTGIKA